MRWLAAACLIAAVGGTVLWATSGPRYSTGIGEQRVVRLDDGSRDMDGLLVRLSPPAQTPGVSPSTQRLTLIERERAAGEKIVRRTPREERP